MRKYFGTDGIRRIANTELTPELVYRVAKAGAYVLTKHADHSPVILIGKDTRLSGNLIESAMTAGFLSYGTNVIHLGVMPTPAVAYLTRMLNADASVVISASHNSYEYNGIKFFSNKGMKIEDSIEEEIEEVMESGKINELSAVGDRIGTDKIKEELIEKYIGFFMDTFSKDIKENISDDFVVGIDTANGATYKVAEEVFKRLGIKCNIINNSPDGININRDCGSTHIEKIAEYVTKNNLSLGIAYDGDGDRCLAVDEKGNIVDGDIILAILSKYLKAEGKLKKDTIVATVMSNLGLNKYAKLNDLEIKQTKVGDRYVLEEMMKNGYNLGGEQSGHIIFLDYNPTGDGILTSLMLITVLLKNKVKLSEASKIINIYPQTLVNAKVNNDKKMKYKEDEDINKAIEELEKEFKDNGRVLIRPSGTESLIRVMIEGENQEYISKKAEELAKLIEDKLKD